MLLVQVVSYLLTFASGMADGGAEALKWRYDRVDMNFNLNDSYWNPQVSYRNKYKGGITANGPKFPGSTTYLVWTTDGYHMLRMVRNTTFIGGVTIRIGKGVKRRKWWDYAAEFGGYYMAYTAGFNLVYEYSTR